jgi:endoglucanase
VVNLFTISATPAYNALTTVSVSTTGTYRYVRYMSPAGSYGDVAEIVFYG